MLCYYDILPLNLMFLLRVVCFFFCFLYCCTQISFANAALLCSLRVSTCPRCSILFFLFHPSLPHASVSCLCYANTRGAAYEHAGASLSRPIPVSAAAAAAATCHRLLLARRPQFPGCCCNCSVHQLQQPSHVIGACHAIRFYTSSPRQ